MKSFLENGYESENDIWGYLGILIGSVSTMPITARHCNLPERETSENIEQCVLKGQDEQQAFGITEWLPNTLVAPYSVDNWNLWREIFQEINDTFLKQ